MEKTRGKVVFYLSSLPSLVVVLFAKIKTEQRVDKISKREIDENEWIKIK